MSDWNEDLTGVAWEEYSGTLLRHRYDPVDVQAVPAVQGDLGIDYWIRGPGDIYQCYGTEFGDTVKERLRLQKEKLGDEVPKLHRNADRIATMISPARCSRYVFLVPKHDSKELLEYAAKKTQEIREAGLSFCAADFEIAVQCLDDFAAERAALLRSGLSIPRLDQTAPDVQHVHDWMSDNNEMAQTIREKIEAIYPHRTPEEIGNLVQVVVENYLCGEDAQATLQDGYPDLYEKTRRIVTSRRRRLRMLGGQTTEVPRETLKAELDELATALKDPIVGIEEGDAVTLSTGTVAGWLADCTLDPR